ncbi:type 1 glutamine amidotransferase domain-containing protein [Marinifilum sp.]|uniref:type 1 glutamine amidotransferase domain-containing protein n=1 Tax=Marinifilum sp. TaxID=2033137 RepID=UPI003BA8AC13
MARILFALTSYFKDEKGWESGCNLLEIAGPYFYLIKNGVDIDFVSPKGGKIPAKQLDLDHPKVKCFFKNKDAMEKFYNSYHPNDIKAENYDAIYFPGGHGVMFDLPINKEIAKIAADIYEKQGVVCAVCHGGAGLLNVILSDGKYLVEGKNLTSFSNNEERSIGTDVKVPFLLETELVKRGAKYSCKANWQEYVIADGRLITGQNPASDMLMSKELVKILKTKI